MWVAGSSVTPWVLLPTVVVGAKRVQPDVLVASQVAPLSTETLFSVMLAAYSVSVL